MVKRHKSGHHERRFSKIEGTQFNNPAVPLTYDPKYMAWLISQQEICPSTGRLHLQFACVFKPGVQVTARQMQAWWPGAAHFPSKKNPSEIEAYCTKDETSVGAHTRVCHGVRPADSIQGARTELDAQGDAFLAGGWAAVSSSTIIRYHKGLTFLQSVRAKSMDEIKNVRWYYGPSGKGKSRRAREEIEALALGPPYVTTARGGWFDGYCGQKVILIDEYDGGMDVSELLTLLDRYDYRMPTKGSFAMCQASHIFITSHHPPEKYLKDLDRYEELARRITTLEFIHGE